MVRPGPAKASTASTSDTMGMLGTVINSLALQDAIEREGRPTWVMSAISMAEVCEPYIRRRAIRHLEKGRVVIFAAGMGNPYFTTDTPAALRAAEIEADVILKGTHSGVDGVYSADPRLDPEARKFDEISFMDVVAARPAGDGPHRDHILQGQWSSDPRLRPDDTGQHSWRHRRRADRYADSMSPDVIIDGALKDAREKMQRASSSTQRASLVRCVLGTRPQFSSRS